MKPEEQQKAIAEYCGIKDIFYVTGRGLVYTVNEDGGLVERKVPNYLHDLNAMHEAENVLDSGEWHKYATYIGRHDTKKMLNALPQIKAEAFLRTIGKWTE